MSPQVIARLLARRRDSIRLVVLNARYSQVAAKLLRKHIDCVIGMETEVTDEIAITFSETFYEAIFDNDTFQDAFDESLDALMAEGKSEHHFPKIVTREGLSATDIRLFAPVRRARRE
ncbi:MAG: hypothetical protein AAGC55_08005 [Myxococcota bacterium]